ncbi:general secretion pathway protein E [Planifilum fimeticola]|jgi:general secretion pathway protein E|uniref:General secretion pathway protein E n=1 Tax=Planifilum fimeticola TaxID=201975 RepID=A0A2T0LH96_9BACL|nr:GspE/PulE family protein [Planifilum fimeticola]PRX41698.1 general secretion pathway protein E [Planifilum fimeticola]
MDVALYVSEMLDRAIQNRASDIHLDPQPEGLRIRQRIDGHLVTTHVLSRSEMIPVISRIKVMGHLDIGEKRLPQDGAMSITSRGERVDVRISTMPTLHGEKVVLRLLRHRPEFLTLSELGLVPEDLERLLRLLSRPHGLVIVTGPTGSGKTTTLYGILQELNRPEVSIVTLEDPVELQISGITQIQINPKAGLTFAQGLRAVLRQDPDLIMVGEVRDQETADIAVRAALTGHRVFSTLHTGDGASAITRLLDMGIAPYRVASALNGVVAQRLVRLLCSRCRGSGCEECQKTGYFGRTGVFEVLEIDQELQRLIVERAPLSQLRRAFREKGYRSLEDAVTEKVREGLTTREEGFRVVEGIV